MVLVTYRVAGRDLDGFVTAWLKKLHHGGGDMRGLLEAADSFESPDSRYLFNASFLYANVGPRAAEPAATAEELLLAAVLGTYQEDYNLFRGMTWTSREDHVNRAFEYAQEIGDEGMARKLARSVLRRSEPGPDWHEELRAEDASDDPDKSAHWDRKMTELDQRELRAAVLFDPSFDFDAYVLDQGH